MAKEKEEKKVSELVYIQSNLKAPKNQTNKFGGYNYRSCEDILEAVKPLLKEVNCSLTISDEIVPVADRIYVKATAILRTPSGEEFKNTAFAREEESKKGMDASQLTGATSSYARKYALNGLFCIDDTKDADALNTSKEFTEKQPKTIAKPQPAPQPVQGITIQQVLAEINAATTIDQLRAIWPKYPQFQKDATFTGAMTAKKDQLLNNGKK